MNARAYLSIQSGLTLIELMIAMALGLFVLLAATGLLLSSKAAYTAQSQTAHIQESGRYAMDILSHAVRQAGHEGGRMPVVMTQEATPNVIGLDAMTLKKTAAGLNGATAKGAVNGSDVLALSFFGDGTAEGDGTILNCAGLPVAAPEASDDAESGRGWSIFFVGEDAQGEPELRCKYRTQTGWNADAIVRGVESFQVLYGVDADGDGMPDRFINADAVDALDGQLPLNGENVVARAADLRRRTHWKKVRSIRIAILVRGTQPARDDDLSAVYELFGNEYANTQATRDRGTRITENDIPPAERNRLRRVFEQTIQLRNDAAGGAA